MKALPWIVAGFGLGAVVAYVVLSGTSPQAETGWDSVDNAAKGVADWGSKARLSSVGTSVAGKVKQGLGRALGDLAGEGALDEAAGAVKGAAGDLAQAAGQTIHDLNR